MSSGIKVSGLKKPMAALDAMQVNLPVACEIAVKLSMQIVVRHAREILEAEQTGNWPDKDGALRDISEGRLYKSFKTHVIRLGKSVVGGELRNTAPEAVWMEFGTQDHFIAPVNADNLEWWEAPGVRAYSRGHEVSGIEATNFMSRAIEESYEEIREVFINVMKRGGFSGTPGAALAFLSDLSDDDESMIIS